MYPSYKLLSSCTAKLTEHSKTDYVFLTFSPKKRDWKYLAVMDSNGKLDLSVIMSVGGTVDLSELNSELLEEGIKTEDTFKFLSEDQTTTIPEINCFTPKKVHEMNGIIQESEGVHGYIKPDNKNDVVCLIEFGLPGGFSCYSFSQKDRKFVSAGGWAT